MNLKFLHLAVVDHGGAGVAAWHMHDQLRKLGHISSMLVLDRRTKDSGVLCIHEATIIFRLQRLAQKIWLKIASRPDEYFQNQLLTPGINVTKLIHQIGFVPDILVVHSISHFLAPKDILALQNFTGAPVLWSLLDMGLMTGGCHYAWDCSGYTRSCGGCPALRFAGENDLSAQIWRSKKRAFDQIRGWLIAGSTLLSQQAAKSSLFATRRIETLLLGVSPNVFLPGNKTKLRSELGISGSQRVIFYGAQKFDQRRKGMRLLVEALLRLADTWPNDVPLPVLLCAGYSVDYTALRNRGFEISELGFVNEKILAKAYSAADVFACPSIEDSGPVMINESMMSGTPVVAFRMGVAEDLIEDGVTGVIAPIGDIDKFSNGLQSVLFWSEPKSASAQIRCREVALTKCLPERQMKNLIEIAMALRNSKA